jgi:uncharacterized coiled-coil DUF342 family protein
MKQRINQKNLIEMGVLSQRLKTIEDIIPHIPDIKDITRIEEKQKEHHTKLGDIHNQLSQIRNSIDKGSTQTQQLIEEHKEIKKVVDNNTNALIAIQEILTKLLTERDTTKNNIGILGKFIIWLSTIVGFVYAGYSTILHWGSK